MDFRLQIEDFGLETERVPSIQGTDHYWRDWTIPDGKVYSPINYDIAIANGLKFTWLKGADGPYDSPNFEYAYADAIKRTLTGVYVWLYPKSHTRIETQVQKWLDIMQGKVCPLAVDFERWEGYAPDHDDLYNAFERYLAVDPRRKMGRYSNQWYWQEKGTADPYWLQYFRWDARYNIIPPDPYAPWWGAQPYTWQYSGSGDPKKWGLTNGKLAVDENQFMGTEDELNELFAGQSPVPPIEPPIGGDMYQVTPVAGKDYINIRAGHAINTQDIGNLYAGQKAQGTELWASAPLEKWLHITSVDGSPTDGWVAVISGGANYTVLTEIGSPPETLPVLHLSAGADGYETKKFDLNPL